MSDLANTATLPMAFDYGNLETETRIVVQQKTGEIKERIKRTANDVIEIGERLNDVKSRLGHGRFMTWLKAEFEWSDRTARNFMEVAETFKLADSANLTIGKSALVALASPSVPEPARQEAIEQFESLSGWQAVDNPDGDGRGRLRHGG